MRDSQRQRVYDAEALYTKFNSVGIKFRSKDEIQMYLFNLVQSPWYKKEFPKAPGTIHLRMAGKNFRSSATPGQGKIRISQNEHHMTEFVVLHELAHVASGPGVMHGRLWCVNFLKLLRKKIGVEAEEKLKECFKQKKVKFRLKRKVSNPGQKGVMPAGFAALQKWRQEQKYLKDQKKIEALKKGLGLAS